MARKSVSWGLLGLMAMLFAATLLFALSTAQAGTAADCNGPYQGNLRVCDQDYAHKCRQATQTAEKYRGARDVEGKQKFSRYSKIAGDACNEHKSCRSRARGAHDHCLAQARGTKK
jgi:hypothetical protein